MFRLFCCTVLYYTVTVQPQEENVDDDHSGEGKGERNGDDSEDKNELTVDRAGAMEDCARLLREAEESLSLAQTSGEALAVLRSTVLAASNEWSSRAAAEVSVEVASAVNEAEGLVDGLLRVIQASSALFPTVSLSIPHLL